MKFFSIRFYLVGLLLSFASAIPYKALAQSDRVKDYNQNGWYMYFGDHTLTDKWGLHTEVQIRRHNWLKDPQQLLLRGGINYNLTESAMFTLGYGFVETYPYGEFPAADDFVEHRIYEQLQLKGSLARIGLTHRYRLEQRWVQSPVTSDYTNLNRARYMLRAMLPLQGPSTEPKELYLAAYDEIFIGFGENVQRNVFDQNRLYVALGYKINKAASLEAGYMNQISQKGNGIVFEHNHTLQVGFTYNIDFRK